MSLSAASRKGTWRCLVARVLARPQGLTVVCVHVIHSIFLVFEYCENDLGCIIDSRKHPFRDNEVRLMATQQRRGQAPAHTTMAVNVHQIKRLIKQILEAIKYCHERWIIHRCSKVQPVPFAVTVPGTHPPTHPRTLAPET